MKEMVDKTCKIHINKEGKNLFYTGTIKSFTPPMFTFIDKYGELYAFRINDIVEMCEAGK